MQVFVTGATGVLGRSAVPLLVKEGHKVRALSRSAGNDALIGQMGAEPVEADLFDRASLEEALAGSHAVLHLATKIPPSSRIGKRPAWLENDRIRTEGSRNLVDAALASGVEAFVYPSFAWVYADADDRWIDASTGVLAPLWFLDSTLAAEEEVARFVRSGRRGVSLRLGSLYGPESPQTQEVLGLARKGFAMVLGRDQAYQATVWVQDAAAALVAAMGAPSGLYDVVDDEPLTAAEYTKALAGAVGKKGLMRMPVWLGKLMSGAPAEAMARSRRISNKRFKEATGWTPSVPSARQGWARLAVPVATAAHAAPTPAMSAR